MAGLAHIGCGFAARSVDGRIRVGWYILAAELPDVLYMILSVMPVDQEKAGYFHHSLAASAAWAVLAGLTAFVATRRRRSSLLITAAVFSHWILDALTWPMTAVMDDPGRMPLFISPDPSIGLGLYRTMAGVIFGEVFFLGGGLFLYIRRRRLEKRSDRAV